MRIVADGNVVLVAHVQTLGVFPHQHEIDVFVAAGNQRARRPHVGVQMKLLAQAHIRRAVAAARRSRQWPFQGEPGPPDALQRGLRQGVAVRFHAGHSGLLHVPLERRSRGVEHRDRGVDDFRTDPVARNQRCRNDVARSMHRGSPRAVIAAIALAHRFPTRRQFDDEPIGHQRIGDPRHPIGRACKIDAFCFDQARRLAERPRIFAARLLDRIVDDALVIELAGQFLSRNCILDAIDINRNAGGAVAIIAVDTGIGTLQTRADRDELEPTGYRLHVETGVQ